MQFVDDKNFDQLGEALKNGDVNRALECTHTLKGVSANMGFTSVNKLSKMILEPLRRGEMNDKLNELYCQLICENNKLKTIIL